MDVNTDQQNSGLEAQVTVDRVAASRLGITMQTIDDALYDAFGQRFVATTYTQLNQYHIVMTVPQDFWQNPNGLQLRLRERGRRRPRSLEHVLQVHDRHGAAWR